jgi:hypothetical protein
MKSLAKSLSVLLFLLAGCIPIFGQNTLLINNIQTLVVHSADSKSEILLTAEFTASSYQFYMEEKIQLEDWMIERDSWKKGTENRAVTWELVDQESEIAMEAWMIQPFSTGTQDIWEFLVESEEEPLKVRKWMICCADWNLRTKQGFGLASPVITLE